jgi:N-acetylglucosamine kinase-like BadF-type ATPase
MSTGLGIDAGGSQTRWALVGSDQSVLAEGSVAGFSALQLGGEAGHRKVSEILKSLADQALGWGAVSGVHAGVTGFGGLQERSGQILHALLARHFKLPEAAIALSNDIELACLSAFEPGMGYLVYGGTGSIAGFIDAQKDFHRAGGRGGILDDGGSGYWITVEALRKIWRAEDERPGCWADSPMAVSLFKAIGGHDWSCSRKLIYGASRGQIGQLAIAVAAAADSDPQARDILQRAGHELGRLGIAMVARFGVRPIVLAGRVPQLHQLIEQSMRERLPPECDLRLVNLQAHIAAARLVLKKGLT